MTTASSAHRARMLPRTRPLAAGLALAAGITVSAGVAAAATADRSAAIFDVCHPAGPTLAATGVSPGGLVFAALLLVGVGAIFLTRSRKAAIAVAAAAFLTLPLASPLPASASEPAADPCSASIGDLVWLDADSDGTQDSGEAGIDGVRVLLLDGAGNQVLSTTTSGGGSTCSTGSLPERIRLSSPPPWTACP